jgi:hypothetical protein
MMVEPASHDASFLRMLYPVALTTFVQLSCADPEPASDDRLAAPIAGQADVFWFEASPARRGRRPDPRRGEDGGGVRRLPVGEVAVVVS